MNVDRRVLSTILSAMSLLLLAQPGHAQDLFRFTDLDLRDPHLFTTFIGCNDVTSTFNSSVQTELTTDSNGDGQLDASLLLEFMPLDRGAATNLFAAGAANCSASSNTCGGILVDQLAGNASLQSAGTCLSPIVGTTRAAYGSITSPAAPCFASPSGTITFTISGVALTLRDTQIAATFADNAPTNTLSNGLVRGFLTVTDANNTVIPASYPVIGGQTLASLLPGGQGNCSANDDKDLNNGVSGWWLYLSFAASRVGPDPFGNGFSDSFE